MLWESEEVPAQPNLHWNSQISSYIERPWLIGSQRVIHFSSFNTIYYIVLLLPWQRGSFYSVLTDLKNISYCFFFYFDTHTSRLYMIFWESPYSNVYIHCGLYHFFLNKNNESNTTDHILGFWILCVLGQVPLPCSATLKVYQYNSFICLNSV